MNPYAQLDALYASLPKLQCIGLCQNSCGPIVVSGLEWRRLAHRVGYEPFSSKRDNTCSLLDQQTGRCTVYALRPTVCRLWGVVENMPCPFGCVPERKLTTEEGYRFLENADEISKKLGYPQTKSTLGDEGWKTYLLKSAIDRGI